MVVEEAVVDDEEVLVMEEEEEESHLIKGRRSRPTGRRQRGEERVEKIVKRETLNSHCSCQLHIRYMLGPNPYQIHARAEPSISNLQPYTLNPNLNLNTTRLVAQRSRNVSYMSVTTLCYLPPTAAAQRSRLPRFASLAASLGALSGLPVSSCQLRVGYVT